ncbi:hypothetical protein ACGF5O_44585 [Streptomyces sp. NPDC048291]|uniref:hypothetical protein n=1 Tax=Streptomyces sp. NPDC048291 TaxID=3365530 RepID=UPI00370FE55B
MHNTARSRTKETKDHGLFREPGADLERLLRDALALIAGTRPVSREPEHHHRPHATPRHRLARSVGHLAGYTLLGYVIVHQRRSLRHLAG